jgi:hypothetical protein
MLTPSLVSVSDYFLRPTAFSTHHNICVSPKQSRAPPASVRADLLGAVSPQIYLIPEDDDRDGDGGSRNGDEEMWASSSSSISSSISVDESEIGAGVSYAELRDGGGVDAAVPARAYGLVDSTGGIQ